MPGKRWRFTTIKANNLYTAGKQTLAASTNAAASMNVPAGAAPTTAVVGDLYTVTGPDSHLQFMDQTSTVQELAFVSDITAANATEAAAIAAETARAQGAENEPERIDRGGDNAGDERGGGGVHTSDGSRRRVEHEHRE